MHVPSLESKQTPGLQKLVVLHEVGAERAPVAHCEAGASWHNNPEDVFAQHTVASAAHAKPIKAKLITNANANPNIIPLFMLVHTLVGRPSSLLQTGMSHS
jgi:hypothetical protein